VWPRPDGRTSVSWPKDVISAQMKAGEARVKGQRTIRASDAQDGRGGQATVPHIATSSLGARQGVLPQERHRSHRPVEQRSSPSWRRASIPTGDQVRINLDDEECQAQAGLSEDGLPRPKGEQSEEKMQDSASRGRTAMLKPAADLPHSQGPSRAHCKPESQQPRTPRRCHSRCHS
jgi:hypothetical protein